MGEGDGCLATLHGHRAEVTKCAWNPVNGQWLLTASKDQTLRLFDVRRRRRRRLQPSYHPSPSASTRHPPTHPTTTTTTIGTNTITITTTTTTTIGTNTITIITIITVTTTTHHHPAPPFCYRWAAATTAYLVTPFLSLCFFFAPPKVRSLREPVEFVGHEKDVTSVAWHPTHERLFSSGGGDGGVAFWTVRGAGGVEG